MRDNPRLVAAVEEVARRERRRGALLRVALPWVPATGVMLGAYRDGTLVGVAGIVEPGRCRPAASEPLHRALSVRMPATQLPVGGGA